MTTLVHHVMVREAAEDIPVLPVVEAARWFLVEASSRWPRPAVHAVEPELWWITPVQSAMEAEA